MSRAAAACISPYSTARKLVSSLLNTKLSSLLLDSSHSLFPSSNRILIPPKSLSFRLHSKSPQGCTICCVQRRPIIDTSAHKLYSNSLFPSSNRIHTPPNSLSFRLHFKSPQGCNICCVQRRPMIDTSARKLYSNSLFPSSNRIHIPPNSLSFPLHFKSPRGCNMQWRPITTTSAPKNTSSALKLHVPPDVDDFLQECETFYAVKDGPLTCPLGWWEGHENEDISQIFEDWCKEYGKTYESDEEKLYRFRVFKYNYEYMRQQNEFGGGSDRLAINRSYDCSRDDVWEGGRVDDRIELPVVLCRTVEAWNEQLAKGQRNNKLITVHFGSDWCRPCALMLPITVRLVKEMPQVTFLVVDVTGSEVKRVAEKLGVDAIPTVLLMKNGEVVDKVVGPLRDEVHRKVAMHASSTASA